MPIESIFNVIHVKLSQMEGTQTLHDVFLDPSCSSNNAIDHLMLC